MKPANAPAKSKRELFWTTVLLVGLLGLLFWKNFTPGFVEFSNDGPLGQQKAEWLQLPKAFTGTWNDLNEIGTNGGTFPLSITAFIRWILGAIAFAKFFVPIALVILGLCAWIFFKQLKLTPMAAILGALATALTSVFFSDACWGVGSHQIAFGMDFLALALVVANSPATPPFVRWVRLVLAGMAVGMNVVEAADIGAVFSIFVAAFVLFHSLAQEGATIRKIGRGIGQILIIAIVAAFLAAQTVAGLLSAFGSSASSGQNLESKAQHWDWATQWSLPKIETLGIIVPGLFGYRMDTTGGGNYWGAIGRDPNWDRFFEKHGPQPDSQFLRFSGDGNYAGALVLLVALWAIVQSLRGQNSIFSEMHRRFLWFWTAILIVSLLLALGRFAPFFEIIYQLPFFSTQFRNPLKFYFVFEWALVIIFAYGIHGLSRRYLETPTTNSISSGAQLKNWWTKTRGFDRNWTSGSIVALVGSLLAWLIYATEKPALVRYLQQVGFGDEAMAKQIAVFSVAQVGWFILFFVLAIALFTLILAGVFSGRRAKWAGIFLGALLILDLGRADLPWVVHWDYQQKYDIDPNNPANSTNPIINFLREKSYEHRVAILPFNPPSQLGLFNEVYRIEWAQHHFPYYNIQSLDVIQNPRPPADLEIYDRALFFRGTPDTLHLITRRWELTSTDYLLGGARFLDALNNQIDPARQRFRIIKRFDVVPKPGIEQPTRLEELTAIPNDNGNYALFEFTGALPRAKLYSNWQIVTNDDAALQILTSTNFDPAQTVLVSTMLPISAGAGTNQNSGTVEYATYSPKNIQLKANPAAPSVLLLNDKFDPNWRVFVDGQRAELLRCNYIMRGVYLTPGAHTVEFQFKLPDKPLYITLTAMGVGILLIGCLIFSTRKGN